MSKILIVLKSEFLRRVRSKWFIVATLVGPLVMIAVIALPVVFAVVGSGSEARTVAVVDETGELLPALVQEAGEGLSLVPPDVPVDSLRSAVRAGTYDGFLQLPATLLAGEGSATYYSAEGGGLSMEGRLEGLVARAVQQRRLARHDTPPEVLDIVRSTVPVQMVKLTEEGEAADSTALSSAVGYLMGFIIYIMMFIYGAYVMHGVLEEKQSRVVEVVISSVRPFQLLMGKVLGIGLMGLLQMVIWSGFILALTVFSGSIASLFLDPADFNLPADASQEAVLQAAEFPMAALSPALFLWFPLFFLGGYLLYASLFAAIGSAVEQQQDAQGLMAPVSMLIVVPILLVGFVLDNPNATLSVVMSLVPFFSPILMIVRLAVTSVPVWQVLAAVVLLAGGFVGTIWLSSRIYRVGILMYGKKPGLKDLARWIRYA